MKKKWGKIANELIFIAFTYLFMDFILLWHKTTKLITVNLIKLYTNLILHKSKQVHFSPASFSLNCGIKGCKISIWTSKYGI